MERETLKQNSEEPQGNQSPSVGSADTANAGPDTPFPDDPFACPHCGQMLSPECRVCVSCKQPVNPQEIARPAPVLPTPAEVLPPPPKEPARFSWNIFFVVLAIWFAVAFAAEHFLGYQKSQFLLGGLVIISAAWVLYDAQKNDIPKGLRWSLGSLLIWVLIFPWYLARRRTPEAPCPFIEGEAGRFARIILFVLVIFLVLSALTILIKGPKPH